MELDSISSRVLMDVPIFMQSRLFFRSSWSVCARLRNPVVVVIFLHNEYFILL